MKTGVVVHTTFKIHQEDVEKFKSIVGPNMAYAAQVPGCQYYAFAQEVNNESFFHLSEGWQDRASLDAYAASPEFKKALAEVGASVRVLAREATAYTVSAQDQL